ncbi:MAG TPA: hypothetical protein PLX69_23410 [Leptospiraceae bacterium]|nr:hypothetical protein [Leptospiraceae bacterium]
MSQNALLTEALKRYNYCLIMIPSNLVQIYGIYKIENNSLEKVGNLKDYFKITKTKYPPKTEESSDIPMDIEGAKSGLVKFKAFLKPLEFIINAFKGSFTGKINAETNFSDIDSILFQLDGLKVEKIESTSIFNDYLQIADVKTKSMANLEDLQSGNLYVLTSILKVNKFILSAFDKNGQSIDIEATLSNIAEGGLNFQRESKEIIKHKLQSKKGFFIPIGARFAQIAKDPVSGIFRLYDRNLSDTPVRGENNLPGNYYSADGFIGLTE